MRCQLEFAKCNSSIRIKTVLRQFKELLSNSKHKTGAQLEQETNELIHNTVSDDQYSNIKLMNDFYHIKYNHNTNAADDHDTNQSHALYNYLCDDNKVLQCDFTHCKSSKRYFNRRNRTAFRSHDAQQHDIDLFAFHILCRIHVYCIHFYDIQQLTRVERRRIENNTKFIETSIEAIDCDKMVAVLTNNGINCDANLLQILFDEKQYNMKQLMIDLCDIFTSKTTDTLQLPSIIAAALHLEDDNVQKQQEIYDTILCSGFITKDDLNHHNFIQMLKIAAFKVDPELNLQQIEEIVREAHLNGNMFIKDTNEFINSVKFGAMFSSIDRWNRKQWSRIYVNIKKWTSSNVEIQTKISVVPNKKPHILSSDVKVPTVSKELCIVENESETKYDDAPIEKIDTDSDIHSIQTFCTLTNCSKDIALLFLQKTSWNMDVAIDRYFRFNGNISALSAYDTNKRTVASKTEAVFMDDEKIHDKEKGANELIYNDGVEFWYWKKGKNNKRYIMPKYYSFKAEILNSGHISIAIWNDFIRKCQLLLAVEHIKEITSNGNNADIYNLHFGEAITVKHLVSIKLYTDCTALCSIFCNAFRLKKIADNQYERMESLMHRNGKVAHWARLLTESVQSYGSLRVSKTKYFRGINSEFVFKRFITRYNAPLSTTYSIKKAMEFSDMCGIIMVLTIYDDYASGLNTSKLSSYSNEKEVLFFGAILRLSSVYQYYDKLWNNYKTQIEGIKNLINIANGSIKWKRKNNMKVIIGHILPHLYPNIEPLTPYIVSLLDYHLRNVPKRIEFDYRELNHQYTWVRHIFIKSSNIPNTANACNLFKYCNHIVLYMAQDTNMNDECCRSLIADMLLVANKNVTVQLKWKSAKRFKDIQALLVQIAAESKEVQFDILVQHETNSIFVKPYFMMIELVKEINNLRNVTTFHGPVKEVNDLNQVYVAFYYVSNRENIDLNKLQDSMDTIHNICDSLWSQIDIHANLTTDNMNVFQLNEWIEIQMCKYLTLRCISIAFARNSARDKTILNQSLQFIVDAIDKCQEMNDLIKRYNTELEAAAHQNDEPSIEQLEIMNLIAAGQLEQRRETNMVDLYHHASNTCQQLNQFHQSLEFMSIAICIEKDSIHKQTIHQIDTIADPISSGDDEDQDDIMDGDEADVIDDIQSQDVETRDDTLDYLDDDVKKMYGMKDKKWNEMTTDEKLYYCVQKGVWDLILNRGITHSNLGNYREALCDAYMCTLIKAKNKTAWNNRAFAWYQLEKYDHCIEDCSFVLQMYVKAKKSKFSFTRGLLHGNKGLAEYKLKLYHEAVNDLNICLKYATNSRLTREALQAIWKEFTDAIYFGCTRIKLGTNAAAVNVPFVIAKIIADYSVGINFEIIQTCHESTIVFH